MKHLKLIFACLLTAIFSIGQVWAAEELKATLDFTTNDAWTLPVGSGNGITAATDYSDGTYTVNLSATTKYYFNSDGYLMIGKNGSKITLPAFSWKTTKIVVTGRSGASTGTKQNIYVGETAVSTETTGCTGANTYNIASANQAAGNVYVFQVTSNHNAQVTKIEIYGEAEGGGSTKTLSSVAVSGNPTKKSYYAGQDFDPAGLVVTGTYSDNSTSPISSGITWSYNPAQALELNQTSIQVKATVGEVTSADWYLVSSLSVTEAPAAVNYEKVTSEPADWSGEYILVYEADASNARVWKGADQANNYAEATISNGVIAAPEDAAVLNIAKVAESDPVVYTIMLGDKYIGQTSDANGIKIQATAINNSISYNGTDAAVDIVASSAHLRYNSASSSYFRYYKSSSYSSQKKIQLYKKVDAAAKPSAELAYADAQKLAKSGESFTAPTLTNPHTVTVSYASDNTEVATVDPATGAVTIVAAGKAVITASFAGNDDYKAGNAYYTIFVAEQAGTAEDPLTEASAKALIDLGCTLSAHVNGLVMSQNSTNFTVTLTNGFQFYKAKDLNNVAFESAYLGAGDEVTAVGALKKFSSTYELDEGCYLTFYEQASTPLTSIANDEASAYTVAQALVFAANPTTYDLSDIVYVRGKVAIASTALFSNKYLTYSISDDGTTTSVLKVYNGLGIDGAAFTSKDDILVGDVVVVKGNLTQFNTELEFAANNELVSKKPVATIAIDNMELEYAEVATISATITPAAAASTVVYSIKAGSDDVITLSGDQITAKSVTGTATIVATIAGTDDYEGATKEFTVSVAEADTRKVANSPAAFTATSGNLDPADIAYASYQGGASTAPAIYNDGIRLYQISGTNTFGGFITLTAKAGCTIDEVQITTTNTYATTVAYSVDGNETLSGSESVAKSGTYTTGTGLNVSSVNILNVGTGSSGRLEIASIKVYYTGEPAAIDHYELGGTYQTAFVQNEDFNHTGLIVYAVYDALGENKVDITSMCTFSEPDMSTTGEKTIEITYNETVVISYTINVAADSRKVAESPVTFTTVSGDMTPNDITFASNQGEAGTAPANYNDGIRLYQAPSADKIGGYITLKAKKGCTIDQVKITTTNSYATTVAYSVDGNVNLLGSESVAKSSDYSTPSGLNVESVNIVNKGTGSNGRLEIASIKVWYTGDALSVDHYILGGTYETTFEQYGTFSYEGLTVTAAYDAGGTITEAVTGFTVEADLSTAGNKKAEVMLNSVKIAEYDITVTASAKEDPALAYSPASVVLTLGQSLSAPTFSNTHNVSPISYNSDKPAVATVDAEGNIALAGGTGVAVITASFAGDDDYIASEATFTITVNTPAEDLSGTWVVATSIAVGDRIIIADVAAAGAVKTMGEQNSNNRAAVASTVDELGVLTPAEGTKTFLVVDAEDGEVALQALNGNYLYAASTSSNHLKETSDIANVNAKWTITIENGVATIKALHEGHTSRNWMRYNSDNDIFSCYGSGQNDIVIYKKGAAPEPTPDYTRDVTNGHYGTICLPKAGTIEGATLYEIGSFENNLIYIDEVGTTLAAGVPYIFYASEAQLNVYYTDKTADDVPAGNANGLFGFYNLSDEDATYDIPEDAGNYILYNDQYWLVSGRAAYIANYRAYIKLGSIVPKSAAPGRRRVAMAVNGAEEAQGVENIGASEKPVKMMINGQLFILRGEKVYDATGRLVK